MSRKEYYEYITDENCEPYIIMPLIQKGELTTEAGCLKALLNTVSTNGFVWRQWADRIKAENNGGYPPFWGEVMLESGLLAFVQATWQKDPRANVLIDKFREMGVEVIEC